MAENIRRAGPLPLGIYDLRLGGVEMDHFPTTEELLKTFAEDPNASLSFNAPSTPFIGRSVLSVEEMLKLRQAI
jgi:hypothetical protein